MLPQQLTHRTLIAYNRDIGHLYTPNTTIRIPLGNDSYFIKTNSLGFRSDFEYSKRRKTSKRAVFLGDSHTAGDGVANSRRFSDRLSSRFQNLECYNFGLSGSGMDQQLLIYKEYARRFEHDIVIFAPHLMDIDRLNPTREYLDRNTGSIYSVSKPYFTLTESGLVLHNVPVPLMRTKIGENEVFSVTDMAMRMFHEHVPTTIKEKVLLKKYSKTYAPWRDLESADWKLARAIMTELIEKADGRPVILCPLPDPRIAPAIDYQSGFLWLEKEFESVYFVDLARHFETLDREARWALHSPKIQHTNETGHDAIADAIAERLAKEGLTKAKQKGQFSLSGSHLTKKTGLEDVYILGISAFYHDSACALVKNGEIIAAAQEERFSRVKNDSRFPAAAINYCLEEGHIGIEDLEAIAFYDNPWLSLERIISSQLTIAPNGEEIWANLVPRWVRTKLRIPQILREKLGYSGKLFFVEHHVSHAASAFLVSPFNDAAILTIDGVGEWATACIGWGRDSKIELLKQIEYPDSLGLLYSAFTYYAGFKVNEGEYKLMGLAPYGKPVYAELIKKHLVDIGKDGSIRLNMKYFGFLDRMCMTNEEFDRLFGGPPRKPESQITQKEANIARSIQAVTEEIILKMAAYAREFTGSEYLVLAGGVALNCVANGRILREGHFKDLWIQPAAGDAGGALGAALYTYYQFSRRARNITKGETIQKGSYWGPAYSNEEVKAVLDSYGYKYRKISGADRNELVAKYLAEGKVIGHFSGRMEFGPRALGARSILGDARNEKTQSILNMKIKYRESFRPFAPTVLAEDIGTYFELDRPSPYMLLVAQVRSERCLTTPDENDMIVRVNYKRSDIPAVTHVDYSARIQSITRKDHEIYYCLIQEFKRLTGYGVIVNTSFNVRGEPIVCTPYDALNCFMNTEMDVLAIEDFILLKKEQSDAIYVKRGGSLEKTSPPHFKKTTEEERIERLARSIFKKRIVVVSQKLGQTPIDLNFDPPGSGSHWCNYPKRQYIVELEKNDAKDELPDASMIVASWNKFTDEEKTIILPIIDDLLILMDKFKADSNETTEAVSDSIYVMF